MRKNQDIAKQVAKKQYDNKLNLVRFRVGDKVLLKNQIRKNKFSPIWIGPYKVIGLRSPITTVVDIKGKEKLFHNNLLKPYNEKG